MICPVTNCRREYLHPGECDTSDDHEPGCAGWEDCDCFPTADQKKLAAVRAWADRFLVGKGHATAELYAILEAVPAPAPSASQDEGRRARGGGRGGSAPMADPNEKCRHCGAIRADHVPTKRGNGLDCPQRADGKVAVVVGSKIVGMDYDNHCAITAPKIEWRDPPPAPAKEEREP